MENCQIFFIFNIIEGAAKKKRKTTKRSCEVRVKLKGLQWGD
jgi:hypothetical protein